MSDYYGEATLESWLAEEVYGRKLDELPPALIALFEKWRSGIESSIEAWMASDEGEGRRSWRSWGQGFYGVPDADEKELWAAIAAGWALLGVGR